MRSKISSVLFSEGAGSPGWCPGHGPLAVDLVDVDPPLCPENLSNVPNAPRCCRNQASHLLVFKRKTSNAVNVS